MQRASKGPFTSSLENLSACVVSISLMLQREKSRCWLKVCVGEAGSLHVLPHRPHSLISLQHPFAFGVKHFECVENGLFRVCP